MFRLMMKISKQSVHPVMNQNVTFTKERFSSILDQTLLSEVYERVWVCGPPVMNEEMVNTFDKLNIPKEKYLIL